MSKHDDYHILLNNILPPIPDRNHDWEAILDGYEPGDPIGYGPNRITAVQNLLDEIDARAP